MEMHVRARTPWHLWVVGLLAAIWNSFGAYDYVMTRSRDLEYLNYATDGHAAVFMKWHDSAGWLVQIGWPLGVWLSLAGALLLLFRSRHAVTAYAISLGGAVASFAAQLMGPFPPEINRSGMAVMAVVISTAITLQLLYAWWVARRGVLA
ncbi:MAG: hypothetical protein JSS36_03305 [Proteobacteria bacterium]|nr:hypothetical protein [Pseudomonadota bacterium]